MILTGLFPIHFSKSAKTQRNKNIMRSGSAVLPRRAYVLAFTLETSL